MQEQQEISLRLGANELEALEQSRAEHGLSMVDQAAEWLLKTGLRRSVCAVTGTSRKLRLVISNTAQDCP